MHMHVTLCDGDERKEIDLDRLSSLVPLAANEHDAIIVVLNNGKKYACRREEFIRTLRAAANVPRRLKREFLNILIANSGEPTQ